MPCSIDGEAAEWADQEDLIAWGRSVRVTSLEAGVGALPPPPHTASDPRGLYRWTGTQPSASTQVANRVHAPGTGLVTLDRLIQPSATQERSVLGHEPWDSQGSRRLTIWWQMDRPQ